MAVIVILAAVLGGVFGSRAADKSNALVGLGADNTTSGSTESTTSSKSSKTTTSKSSVSLFICVREKS